MNPLIVNQVRRSGLALLFLGVSVPAAAALGEDVTSVRADQAQMQGTLGAPQFFANSFDWGLPFFYGRRVYTAIEGTSQPGGLAGPYVAF